ncbi:2-aminoethylphosphonate--pyruvate transaminase [uncultured Bacteroides sp.]|uniref:2-aminoethylphosphonate--pyruvate transaminase n=1 Tax=uncultured Bacteroides sp. TaxID=162156 RepID=UPI002AA92E45|nr:2-aminoethylphosphonate--pyruvate transaminase [uncultured Bacteroides sp.]
MNKNDLPENPYLLLTPGPLSTSKTVKAAMLRDWCTWDDDYNLNIVQEIRHRLVALATQNREGYTSVLLQGSGTYVVESVIGTVVPASGKLLIIANGAYGMRMIQIAQTLRIAYEAYTLPEVNMPDTDHIKQILENMPDITHVAVVHSETTTGMMNPVRKIATLAQQYNKTTIVDAMSSFGGVVMDIDEWGIDYIISSANKCIQGVPGFGFVVARKEKIAQCKNQARSLSLDLYDQWATMEKGNGKWRFTSPTHVVRAFLQALVELEEEGGVEKRQKRYVENQKTLVCGMRELGFETLLPDTMQSHIITSFLSPSSEKYEFLKFYHLLKENGFIIYPGKVAQSETFRIGDIGEVYPKDIENLINVINKIKFW